MPPPHALRPQMAQIVTITCFLRYPGDLFHAGYTGADLGHAQRVGQQASICALRVHFCVDARMVSDAPHPAGITLSVIVWTCQLDGRTWQSLLR